jgi:putative ABC transport system substrate-binding protein
MNRRESIGALLVASSAWLALAAMRSFAQAPKALRRIVFLHPGTEAGWRSRMDIFRAVLKELGHVEARDIAMEVRWGNDRTEALAGLAAEVVATNPAVIVTASSAAVAAFKKATSKIPVVFATAGDPVEQGFVASLGRPGGNITGVIVHSGLSAKIVEIAREALPGARRFAILVHDPDPVHKSHLERFSETGPRFKFEPVVVRVAGIEDLDRAFRELAERKAEALFIPNLAFVTSHRGQIVERALKARLPLLGNQNTIPESGGLLSYGTTIEENYRRAAALVDKILRGAKPGDLPVEQPERFELIVNMKTAKAIGVKLSPTTMLRANRVIE